MAVVDASVQVALLRDLDPHRPAVRAWYRQAIADQEPLCAPAILLAELGAALGRGLVDAALARRAVQALLDDGIVTMVPVDADVAARAADLAAERGLRGCDAVYVAVAAQRGEPLVTLDRRQAAGASGEVSVVMPT
jgi:predicted nucleic acid-binding protein